MTTKITGLIILLPLLLVGQTINNFDSAPEDSAYWGYETNENAHADTGFVNVSYITDTVLEGAGALKLEYSAHNAESWGGYSKVEHFFWSGSVAPDPTGVWRMAPEAGALMVGPSANNGDWWASSADDVTTRACFFDDEYIFHPDGTFENVLQGATWVEGWQSGPDTCGTPVAPHDGSNAATWEFDESAGTILVDGVGAYLGIPKPYNMGELADPANAPDSIVYSITLTDENQTMTVVVQIGDAAFWTFKLVAVEAPLHASTWKMAPEAGALMVGPSANNGDWWASSADDVTGRACFFDDEYVFNSDGTFENVLQSESWIETWQGATADGCGAPVAPHDGSNAATWEYDATAGTVRLDGVGAFLGIPKPYNMGELADPANAPDSIVYNITISDDKSTMTVVLQIGDAAFWTYKLVAVVPPLLAGIGNEPATVEWNTSFNKGISFVEMLPPEGELWDWSGYDTLSFSYNNSVPQSDSARIHLRLNLSDYHDVTNPESHRGLGEYYYSFHYILDNDPGWNTVNIPLIRNDDWNGAGFNLTGWAGEGGNGELDKEAIAGFHFEFSIGGAGEGDHSFGTIILDDFKLTGSLNALSNPGFETADVNDDGFGWGSVHAGDGEAHAEILTDAAIAHSGDDYLHIGTDNAAGSWAVVYTEDSIPAAHGETWRISAYAKSIGIAGDFGGFKLEGKDADGNVTGDTGDMMMPITDEWSLVSAEFIMPEGTVQASAVIVASRWDGSTCDYLFDDVFLMNVGQLDVVAPVAVTGVAATAYEHYNMVTWTDVAGEEDETYNVYASQSAITDVNASNVDVVAKGVLEGASAAVHYLYSPLEDESQDWYYAVTCVDASENTGDAGSASSAVTNTASGIPVISMNPPASFAADGDLSEWYSSDIVPFVINPVIGHVPTGGAVDDEDDLDGTVYLAIDEDFLYFAMDVIDDDYFYGAGNWWDHDALQLFIGLYDWTGGPKHNAIKRGDEPDYIFYMNETTLQIDNPNNSSLSAPATADYYFESYDPDYAAEGRISLDTLAAKGDEAKFVPVAGMRIPIDIYFHDNDAESWEGNVGFSHLSTDQQWNNPGEWAYTWIGEPDVSIDDEIIPFKYALRQNYPNPFNPVTYIQFTIAEQADVKLRIYDVLGRQVDELVNESLPIGHHKIVWNPTNMASGVYFYKLESGSFVKTRKMILLK